MKIMELEIHWKNVTLLSPSIIPPLFSSLWSIYLERAFARAREEETYFPYDKVVTSHHDDMMKTQFDGET